MVKMTDKQYEYKILTELPDVEMRDKWDDFLQDTRFATHYVTPDFFIDPFAGRGQRFAVLAMNGDRIDAVLTGVKRNKSIASGLAVRPQTAFRNGIDLSSAAMALAVGVASFAGETGELIDLHSWEVIEGLDRLGYEHKAATGADQVVMLDLTKGPDQLFKEFSERRRTDLRKTIKQDKLTVKMLETEAELAELYEIHKHWNGRKGNKPDSFDWFQAFLTSKNRVVLIAIFEGKVVAGTYLRFCERGVVEYAANNSLAEYQKLRPNELLGWRAIEWACSAGFAKFSMGASHPFLARFGGELRSAYRYRLDRTFLKVHVNRERLSQLALKTYLSLPTSIRHRIKSATARI